MAISELKAVIQPLVERVNALEDRQNELLKAIAAIKPTVNMPPRPREFSVEITDDEPGTKRMRVVAGQTH